MTTAEKLVTADEFARMPDPPDGGKMEPVDGRVVVMAPPAGGHGRRAFRIAKLISNFTEPHELGEIMVESGFRLTPENVRAPDVSFLECGRIPEGGISDRGFIPGAPTLAVEVVSPDDMDRDVGEKTDEYLAAGADRVWIVRPRTKTVTVFRAGGDAHTYQLDDTLTSDDAGFPVDGFALPLTDLFG